MKQLNVIPELEEHPQIHERATFWLSGDGRPYAVEVKPTSGFKAKYYHVDPTTREPVRCESRPDPDYIKLSRCGVRHIVTAMVDGYRYQLCQTGGGEWRIPAVSEIIECTSILELITELNATAVEVYTLKEKD